MKESPKTGSGVSKEQNLKCLNRFFETWPREHSVNYESVLKFIRRCLRQYHLSHYQESDILHESYKRAHEAIKKGKDIHNIPGWIRSTALRVIQETSKKEKSQNKLAEKLKDFDSVTEDFPSVQEDTSVNKDLKRLIDNINNLDEEDQKILHMRALQGLSWEEIKAQINFPGELPALRQRYHRLKKKLRN